MKKQNNEYVEQDEVQDFNMGFEMDLGDAELGLEGIPIMDLEIGLTDF